jgi:hypothetical protein
MDPAVAAQLMPVWLPFVVAGEVTPVLLFVTVAVNWTVWPGASATAAGVIAIEIGNVV